MQERGIVMEVIKKIIAKASYGQNIQSFNKDILINTYDRKKPSEILGCIITGAEILSCSLEEVQNGKGVRVNGKFDVNLWYGLSSDTKVAKVSTNFSDVVVISAEGVEKYNNEEVRTWIEKAPEFFGATITGQHEEPDVVVQVQYELGAEIIGQTSLNVKVIESEGNTEEDDAKPQEIGETMDDEDD